MHTLEKKPTIRQYRQKITFHGDLPTVHYCNTHRSSALPGGPVGGLPSLSLTTEVSMMHLGEGRQASHQPSDASTTSSEMT